MVLLRHMKGPLEEPRLGRSRRPVRRNVTVAATGQASVSGNALVAKHPEAFSYDADGNLTQDGRWHYTWDGENRLVRMSSANTNPAVGPQQWVEFEYDWQGRRISKKVGAAGSGVATNDLRFVYDGWNLVAILNSDFSLLTSFAWGLDLSGTMDGAGGVGGLLWMTVPAGANAGTYCCAYDGNGNVMALVSAADGSVAARYEYGPFGELIRATGPMAKVNPFRFSTKYQDEETGLVYYGYRYYDPGTGRWPNRDPLGEPGFELVASRSKGDAEQTIDRLRKALSIVRERSPALASELKGYFLRQGLDLENVREAGNLYAFVNQDAINHLDVNGLEDKKNDKDNQCCDDKAAKDLAKKSLTSMSKKLEAAAKAGGDPQTQKALGVVNKALFAIDAAQRIKKACGKLDGCDDFMKTGDFTDCMLCCSSINSLFGKEVAGLSFLTSCRIACANAD